MLFFDLLGCPLLPMPLLPLSRTSLSVHRLLGRCHPLDPVSLAPQAVPEGLTDQVCNVKGTAGTFNCGEGYVCLNGHYEAAYVSGPAFQVMHTVRRLLQKSVYFSLLCFPICYVSSFPSQQIPGHFFDAISARHNN